MEDKKAFSKKVKESIQLGEHLDQELLTNTENQIFYAEMKKKELRRVMEGSLWLSEDRWKKGTRGYYLWWNHQMVVHAQPELKSGKTKEQIFNELNQ